MYNLRYCQGKIVGAPAVIGIGTSRIHIRSITSSANFSVAIHMRSEVLTSEIKNIYLIIG
jgi:hypothetical protein